MFRALPAADPPTGTNVPVDLAEQLIPLSVLELDLAAPGSGWATYLADRGISITIDDIGRASVDRSDARQLLTEQRQIEARGREKAAELERQAIEADQRFRASLGVGLPAAAIPHGMTYGELIAAAELDSQQYRPKASLVEDLLSNDGSLTFHSLQDSPPQE